MSNFFDFGDGENLCSLCLLHHLEEDQTGEFVKHAIPLPQEVCHLILLFWMLVLQVDLPKLLRHKLLYLLVTLDNEAQCRKLAGTVGYDPLLIDCVSEEESLEARKTRSNSQVDLLAHLHRISHVLVRRLQIISGPLYILLRQSREMRPVNFEVRLAFAA